MLSGVVVLVVDDDQDSQDLITQIMVRHGASVLTAGTGWEGLLIIGRTPPDVLLSDIGLPEMDGYDMIKKIRRLEQEDRIAGTRDVHLPAAAVTALASAADRRKIILAGFRFHIPKPINISGLVKTITTLAGRSESRA